jgi:arsenical pump membrane protein
MTSEVVAGALLAATLAFAVVRPHGLAEAVAAVPAALLVVAAGGLAASDALQEVRDLAPTVAFLAAVLALADLCDREGCARPPATGWWAPPGAGR